MVLTRGYPCSPLKKLWHKYFNIGTSKFFKMYLKFIFSVSPFMWIWNQSWKLTSLCTVLCLVRNWLPLPLNADIICDWLQRTMAPQAVSLCVCTTRQTMWKCHSLSPSHRGPALFRKCAWLMVQKILDTGLMGSLHYTYMVFFSFKRCVV